MKVTAVSDLHGNLPKIKKTDMLLIAGDISPTINHSFAFQVNWYSTEFTAWLSSLEAKHIVFVAGNHDIFFQNMLNEDAKKHLPSNVHYLNNEIKEIGGISIYGTPWTPMFCNWAFMATDNKLGLGKIFKDGIKNYVIANKTVDVILSHGPCNGISDVVLENPGWCSNGHLGSRMMNEVIEILKPKYFIFGHIHSANHNAVKFKDTTYACVSLVNEDYNVVNDPLEFEL